MEIICQQKTFYPIFFVLFITTLRIVWLTVSYIHNSCSSLFIAFQQPSNPSGWKYSSFVTVTRAMKWKYEQLQDPLSWYNMYFFLDSTSLKKKNFQFKLNYRLRVGFQLFYYYKMTILSKNNSAESLTIKSKTWQFKRLLLKNLSYTTFLD